MRSPKRILFATLCLCLVTACASTAPPLRDDRTAIVSGHETAKLNAAEARQAVLLEAARITVDHGYQYFVVLHRQARTPAGSPRAGANSAIQSGDDVTIKVFRDGEIAPGTHGVFDAQRILTGETSQASVSAPVYVSQPATTPVPQPNTSRPQPRCTAYGCSW